MELRLKNHLLIKLSALFIIVFSTNGYSQAVLISTGGTVNVAGTETFYDAGGGAGNDGNTNKTITLCPTVSGKNVCVDFTMFNTYYDVSSLSYAYGDSLCLFDGASTTSNKIATLSGNYASPWNNGTVPTPVGIGISSGLTAVTAPGIFCSTNATGCITASFFNIDAAQSPGWSANVTTYQSLGAPGCSVTLAASNNTICSGTTVTLTATGNIISSALNNNFNSSTVGTGWQGTSSATFTNNACSKPSLDGSTYLWMASSACPRTLTSNGIDVSNGGTVSFEYRSPDNNSDPSPCEAPDINGSTPEAVFLQYSTNAGTTWNNLKVMFPNNIQSPSLTGDNYLGCGYEVKKWSKIVVPIPASAQTTSTQFRWIMPKCTSASTDNWGLDNVVVSSPKTSTMTVKDITNNVVLVTSTLSPITLTVSPTSTTVYQATITDGTTTCTSQQTITVTGGASPVTSFSYSNAYCSNASNPTPTLAVGFTSGGAFSSTPVGLSLNTASGAINLASSSTGTYVVTYTVPASSCGVASNSSATVIVNPTPTVSVNSATLCSGSNTLITASGASLYSWNTGATTNTLNVSPLTTTIYTITGTTNGCSANQTATVTINNTPTITVNSGTLCSGTSTLLTVSGASTYSWNTGVTTSTINVSPTTTTIYTVTGTTAGCTSVKTTTISVVTTPTITVNNFTICPSGSATITASGAATYTWSPFTTLNSANGSVVIATPVSSTNYTVVGSIGSCTSTTTSSVTVGSGISITSNPSSICIGTSTVLSANGASNYTWSPSATLSSTNGTTVTASPTVSTTYTLTGTTGICSGSTTVLVTVNAIPTLTVNNPTICSGNIATLNASGATSYSWSAGLSSLSGATVTATPTVTTVYTVTGTTTGCSSIKTVTINVIQTPTVTATSATICSGSSTTLTASGASSYTWMPGMTTNTTLVISPLINSTYTVIGSNGTCTSSANGSVSVSSSLSILSNSASICSGGTATLSASGASSYTWMPMSVSGNTISVSPTSNTTYTVLGSTGTCTGSTTVDIGIVSIPTITVNNATICSGSSVVLIALGASTYTWSNSLGLSSVSGSTVSANPISTTVYTVTGLNGCLSTTTTTVTVVSSPTITVNSETICSTASATLIANGAINYTWSPSSTLSNSSGSVVIASPSNNTIYTVIGSNGTCTSSVTSSITVSAALSIIPISATICAGSSATLSASGAITYTWSPSLTLNTSNGATVIATPSINTTYTINGTNSTCTGSTTVNVNVNPLPIISVNSATICSGTSTVLSASGAATYIWSNGISTQSVSVSPSSISVYTVVGTLNGCSSNNTSTVMVNATPTVVATSASVCPGASAILTASGATTYSWSNGSTTPTISVSPSTNTIYTVTGVDNSCSSTANSLVSINSIPVISVNNPTLCIGSSVVLSATGATTFSWSNAVNATTISVAPITTSIYTVTGTKNGCTGIATSTVVVISNPTVTVNSPSICSGSNAMIIALGAASYSWSNGATTNTIIVSPPISNSYSVVGATAGCTATAISSVSVTSTPTLITSSDVIIAPSSQTTLNVSGGVTYTWSPVSSLSCENCNSPVASPTITTQYCVSALNGSCSSTACVLVEVEPACYSNTDYATPTAFTPNGDGINDCFNLKGWSDCTKSFYIAIYDRWGEKIFESDDVTFCWDGKYQGKLMDPAVFVFYIKAEIIKAGGISKKGNLTLIR